MKSKIKKRNVKSHSRSKRKVPVKDFTTSPVKVRAKRDPREQWIKSKSTQALRRLWLSYPGRDAAIKKAQIGPALYECNSCKLYIYTGSAVARRSELLLLQGKLPTIYHVDHMDPVVDPDIGYVDLNTFADRLFCPYDNLQVLCPECHDIKTREEDKKRKK